MKCKFIGCGRSYKNHPDLHYYRFPKDLAIRRKWIKACVANESEIEHFKLTHTSRLCSLHFPHGKFNQDGSWNDPIEYDLPDEEWIQYENDGELPDDPMPSLEAVTPGDSSVPSYRMRLENVRLRERVKKLNSLVCRWRNRFYKLSQQMKNLTSQSTDDGIGKIFHADQAKLLSGRIRQVKQWSDATVMDSLQLRFACQGGYDKLIKKGFPFPASRTLLRRIEHIKFSAGIQEDIFELLQYKVANMSTVERDCGLILDEMSLDEASSYCASTKQLVGTTTLPPSGELASKALVVMLVGIAERWKQVVAYEFTPKSIPSGDLKELVLKVIRKAEEIGLRIQFVTSDSGSENQKMWKDFGLNSTRDNINNNLSLPHPIDSSRLLEIVPDPVHVFKNCVNGWINNEALLLPEWYVRQKGLSSNIVHRDHLIALVEFEAGSKIRMAHRLTPADVNFNLPRSSVDKMKVANATKYCNHAVAAGLRVVAGAQGRSDLLPTACFIEDISSWFEVMNNRSEDNALQNNDRLGEEIDRLRSITQLIFEVRVGIQKTRWKPWQTGLILCTNAVIRLTSRLLANGHKKIFTSRFVQDCLESLFSVVRAKQRRPTPRQFASSLRVITLSQYMAPVPNSSYEYDDQQHLLGMAEFLTRRRKEARTPKEDQDTCDTDIIDVDYQELLQAAVALDRGEQNALLYVAGYVLRSLTNRMTSCKQCLEEASNGANGPVEFRDFCDYRQKTSRKRLLVPSAPAFDFFRAMEVLYRNSKPHFERSNGNIDQKLCRELAILPDIFHCTKFKTTLIRRYVFFRLRSGEEKKQRKRKFDSRSMVI